MENPLFPPIISSNLNSLQDEISKLNEIVKTREYHEAARCATAIIDQIISTCILQALDIRSYSYAMMGKSESAIADTQRMIGYAPEMSSGYIRKGSIFSLYGQQIQAIEAFDEGLQTIKNGNVITQRLQMARSAAATKNEQRIDIIAKLPMEISKSIFMRLPFAANATCLTVSKLWRQRTIQCTKLWDTISLDNDSTGFHVSSVTSNTGHYVRNLTINSDHALIRGAVLQNMKNGYFKKLKMLKITAIGSPNLREDLSTVAIAFYRMSTTLKTLNLDLGVNTNGITLADILLACSSVTNLKYSTQTPLHTTIGNFSLLKAHYSLTSLHLVAESITGSTIELPLQKCQQLRQLIINGCDTTVFTEINNHAHNLEILSYNNDDNICNFELLQDARIKKPPGLRKIYTSNGGTPVSTLDIFPLIYKNMLTLESAYLNISAISEQERQQLQTSYPELKFAKLTSLTYWPKSGIQLIIAQSIRETTTLASINLVGGSKSTVDAMVNTIMMIPPLKTLQINHIHDTRIASTFVKLFERYARLSETKQSLESMTFWKCSGVNDPVLTSLMKIKTLNSVYFTGTNSVTSSGISSFLENINPQLIHIHLDDVHKVTDEHISALGGCGKLKTVSLKNIPGVTDQGIRAMLDKGTCKIYSLTVESCPLVTKDVIRYAQKKIMTVIYN